MSLVESGVVTPRTFVISQTGHDIPIAATLREHLGAEVTFSLPRGLDPPVQERLRNQSFTWRSVFAASSGAIPEARPIFLGVEAHRKEPVEVRHLPTATQLARAGIDRVVMLVEAPLHSELDGVGSPELVGYLAALRRRGLEVSVRGVRTRSRYDYY
jgi:hypothetical protein